MKKLFFLATAAFLLLSSFYGCKKSDNNSDLTSGILGIYKSKDVEITVNKIDNSSVSMLVKPTDYCFDNGLAFTNVKMNSTTSFTLNEITYKSFSSCTKTINGTGTVSGNNISLFTVVVTDKLGGTCCFNKNESINYSASK